MLHVFAEDRQASGASSEDESPYSLPPLSF